MAPQLDAYAQRNAGAVLVAKVDTDRSPNVSQRFGIRSIPTLAVFVGGREAGREVGAVPIARLEALVARARGPQG
jgi:thioredoxin 2